MNLSLSETPKTGFVATVPNLYMYVYNKDADQQMRSHFLICIVTVLVKIKFNKDADQPTRSDRNCSY